MRDVLAVATWWILIELIGLAAWPLAARLLRFLPDRGYTASKPLGLLLASYALWLLGSLGLLPNSAGGILFALALVVAASVWALSREAGNIVGCAKSAARDQRVPQGAAHVVGHAWDGTRKPRHYRHHHIAKVIVADAKAG